MRIGIYGGTFNPPHLGHLTAARTAFELLKLDKLYLIPAAVPPHKPLPPGSPDAAARLARARRAAGRRARRGRACARVSSTGAAAWRARATPSPSRCSSRC